MTDIHLQSIAKRFGDNPVLSDIELDFAAGSFTALLGPSGCGKTTLLRLIAGFEAPSAGRILFGDRTIATPERQDAPEDRGVGIVFQSYALWPHMDVEPEHRLSAQGAPHRAFHDRRQGARGAWHSGSGGLRNPPRR